MSQKKQLLHELLQDDQEPFHLKNHIQDKSFRLIQKTQKPISKPYPIQPKKRNPISTSFTCKNTCLFALTSSPADPMKSPAAFIGKKCPCRTSPGNGAVFLHVPAKTASLLLEAALRIQKQSANASGLKPGSSTRFGLFGSLFKRLTLKNNKNVKGVITSSPPLTGTDLPAPILRTVRRTSTIWSGSSEEKDIECFTSSSGSDSDDRKEEEENNDGQFCESPFHFALSTSHPSPGSWTPEVSSPATSPSRQNTEDHEHNDVGGTLKFQVQREENEEKKDAEEDKEQCSPVSVLDPPFEDDYDEEDGPCDDDQTAEDDGFDLECSYAIVQRAKKQLMRKLRKFEKLAGLDPVELEKRMMDKDDPHCDDYDMPGSEEEAECRGGLASTNAEENIDMFIMEELRVRNVPKDMKRLVSDVIDEEERNEAFYANGELMSKRVCKRFESWKDVECNTIDMMVEMDFKGDQDQWKRCSEQVHEAVLQIEIGIFGLLMEELTEELQF